jgi:hypothetical protein
VANFTNPTPISLLISCKLSFLIFGLEICYLPTLASESPKRIFICYLGDLNMHTQHNTQPYGTEISISLI